MVYYAEAEMWSIGYLGLSILFLTSEPEILL
jgi:hypothetical protein